MYRKYLTFAPDPALVMHSLAVTECEWSYPSRWEQSTNGYMTSTFRCESKCNFCLATKYDVHIDVQLSVHSHPHSGTPSQM